MPRAGDEIERWILVSHLGGGGNADVWRASEGQGEVALKMLRPRGWRGEPLKRFRREVELQTQLTGTEGVMPILSSSVLGTPSVAHPPWAAMPVATPLRRHLADEPTARDVVACMFAIAKTLAALHEQGISHRDIKPENLFFLDAKPVIGDFGLVDGPDLEPITVVGRPLGSRFYIAPELITDPTTTNGIPADVYALGKTLWVLLTGHNAPLPGQMRLEEEALRVSSYRPKENLRGVDALIDAMTANAIADRPTIENVIRSLDAYLNPPTESTTIPALRQIAEDLDAILEPRRRRSEEAQLRADMLRTAVIQIGQFQSGLIESLNKEGVTVHSSSGDFVARHAIEIRRFGGSIAGGGGATFGNVAERPATLSTPNGFFLISGLGVLDMGSNVIRICGGHIFARRGGHYGPTQVNSYALWFDHEDVVIGTDAVAAALTRLADEIRTRLPGALATLVAKLNEFDLR